jgi:hypothetical protein
MSWRSARNTSESWEYRRRAFRLGQHVYDVADPRHVGRIYGIMNSGSYALVRWLETGWKSEVPCADLRAAP